MRQVLITSGLVSAVAALQLHRAERSLETSKVAAKSGIGHVIEELEAMSSTLKEELATEAEIYDRAACHCSDSTIQTNINKAYNEKNVAEYFFLSNHLSFSTI